MINLFQVLKNRVRGLFKENQHTDKILIYLAKYLKRSEGITLIDIGAHRGDFFNQVNKHYNIRKAVLIEPIPHLANYLKGNFKSDEIHVYNNAVSDKDFESIEFQINEFEETSSILQFKSDLKELANVNTRPAKREILITRTLDSIFAEVHFKEIDLIKIDVQGVEHLVLNGAKTVLETTKYLWIELSFKPLYIGSSVFNDIYSLMEKFGFILLEISPGHRSPDGELLQADALFANPKFL
jgi:FkbM family methyltransferase